MNRPLRPHKTGQEKRAAVTDAEVRQRTILAFLWLFFPMVMLVRLAACYILFRQRKISRKLYFPFALALGIPLTFIFAKPYFLTWYDLWIALRHSVVIRDSSFFVSQVSTRWLFWMGSQLPATLGAGIAAGAWWGWLRDRRRPIWREKPDELTIRDDSKVGKAVQKLVQWPLSDGESVTSLPIRLGATRTGSLEPFEVTVGELNRHAFLDGPTGFGKTTTLLELVAGIVASPYAERWRCPVIFITMKPDTEITASLRDIAEVAGRNFRHITQCSGNYNPFDSADADEIASAVIETEANSADGGFSEPHHRAVGTRFLRYAARALVHLNRQDPGEWPKDYIRLASLMSLGALDSVATRMDARWRGEWARYRRELAEDKDLLKSVSGMRQRISNAAESGARDVLDSSDGALSLERAIDAGDLVLFDLDSARDALSARLIGNLALQDLTATMSRLGRRNWKFVDLLGRRTEDPSRYVQIIVDEFSALGGTLLDVLYRQVRTHGAGVLLATQEAGSLEEATPLFKETIITNSNVLLLHQQSMNAEFYAELLGTKESVIETVQIFDETDLMGAEVYASGQGNLRVGQEFRVHPNELRELRIGELMVRIKTRGSTVYPIKVRRSTSELKSICTDHEEYATLEATPVAIAPVASSNPYLVAATVVDDHIMDSTPEVKSEWPLLTHDDDDTERPWTDQLATC